MTNPVVVSLLWAKNQTVSAKVARAFAVDIAVPKDAVGQVHRDEIAAAGRRCIALGEPPYEVDTEALSREANRRLAAVQAPIHRLAYSAVSAPRGTAVAEAMIRAIAQSIFGSMRIIALLQMLHERERIAGVVVNESEAPFGKSVALWAQAHGIPVVVLSHGGGIGEAYTVTREFVADYLLFAGRRGAEPYLDAGFPRERIAITGNPAWDMAAYAAPQRDQYRRSVYEIVGLDPALPLIVFATTWNARLTALQDANVYTQTLRAFLSACRIATAAGLQFHALVKDRPPNADFGSAEMKRLSDEVHVSGVRYATGDMLSILMASDLMVGYDTSAFIEAMLAGIPCINIWTPSSWLIGPGLAQSDGIPMVQYSNPGALAELFAVLLRDRAERQKLAEGIAANLPRFALANDGQSAARCADAIGTLLALSKT